jgi:peptidoglycan/xylan/chitin deacetylase (PgdA/CDA1 family)
MSIRSLLGAARRGMLSSLCRRVVPFASRDAIVSFTFDDFPRNAYNAGGSILEEFGARGTYYAAAGLMNTLGELGEYFCADDLIALLAKGHELGSHTFSHISGRSVSCPVFCADVEKSKQALEELTEVKLSNFSYPFGHVTLRTKKVLAPHVASARGITPGFNGPEIDLNLLRANRLYGDVGQAPRLNALIQENVRRKSWLIFYTHDVRQEPSEYGCTPELFESVVSFAAQSRSRILTVAQTLGELGVLAGAVRSAGKYTDQTSIATCK